MNDEFTEKRTQQGAARQEARNKLIKDGKIINKISLLTSLSTAHLGMSESVSVRRIGSSMFLSLALNDNQRQSTAKRRRFL